MAKQDREKWSAGITKTSNALDLEPGVFTWKDSRKIALSLKKSAQLSLRRKGTVYKSAMSMLSFYINRAGKKLPPAQKKVLEQAKTILRQEFINKP